MDSCNYKKLFIENNICLRDNKLLINELRDKKLSSISKKNIVADSGLQTILNTELLIAASHCDLFKMETALENGANPNAHAVHEENMTSLMYISYKDFLKKKIPALEMLYKYGADINDVDNQKFTALMYAAVSDNLPVIKKLLEYNADPNKLSVFDKKAIDYTTEEEIKELLISAASGKN
jgi:ankyrin repeat protein